MIDWRARRYWIFDLDGTLTRPILDFPKMKKELGLPPDRGILEAMAGRPEAERKRISATLDAMEWETAGKAKVAEGAHLLLKKLALNKAEFGIVTRNKKDNAIRTLAVMGLAPFFRSEHIIGRDEAPPKPDPGGIRYLLLSWNADPGQAVMVGDFRFDLEAGRTAEVATVYVDGSGRFPFRTLADLTVPSLDCLIEYLS